MVTIGHTSPSAGFGHVGGEPVEVVVRPDRDAEVAAQAAEGLHLAGEVAHGAVVHREGLLRGPAAGAVLRDECTEPLAAGYRPTARVEVDEDVGREALALRSRVRGIARIRLASRGCGRQSGRS